MHRLRYRFDGVIFVRAMLLAVSRGRFMYG